VMIILETRWVCHHFSCEQVVCHLAKSVVDKSYSHAWKNTEINVFSGNRDSYQNEKFMRGCRFLEAELQDMDRIRSGRYNSLLLPYLFALPPK
jgi:hypothetical protein